MRKFKTAAILGGALGGAMLLASQAATAGGINIDGITFDSGPVVFTGSVNENSVAAPGDELMGFGRIDAINQNRNYCSHGPATSCELTYTFGGYTATDVTPQYATFTGGTVRFYADTSPNYSGFDRSTATDGDLFLVTTGHTYKDTTTGHTGTLIASGTNLTTDQAQGDGHGYLDVTGGDAMHNLDTDTFSDFMGGTTDIQFDSTFSPNACAGTTDQPICGSVSAKAQAVPEPSTLGMMGLGLVGLGFAVRRRRRR